MNHNNPDDRQQRRIWGILNNMRHQANCLKHDSMYNDLHKATRAGLSLGDCRMDRPNFNPLGPRPVLNSVSWSRNDQLPWNSQELPPQAELYPPRGLIAIYSPPGAP